MRSKKDKGPLRNFYLLKKADDELMRQSVDTGRNMTKVIEDLLLKPIKPCPPTEQLLDLPGRVAVDEAGALAMLSLDKQQPAAAKKAFWRFRRMNNIKMLPGGVYSVRAIERAST
jgi:hypothetical protein